MINQNITEQNININPANSFDEIKEAGILIDALKNEVSRVIIGNTQVLNFITISILCNGHILLEGVPGVAKTTIIKTIANALGLEFKRIQFTPDLLPSDLIGTLIYNAKKQEFETRKGPIFANLILADEINRAPAKVQSALLESMQEHQVTIGSNTFKLEEPFFVFATQNPIEQHGTYQLPEAQLDRFMFKLIINYPNEFEEKEILKKSNQTIKIEQVLDSKKIFKIQQLVQTIYIDEKVIDYIIKIVNATRNPAQLKDQDLKNFIQVGASPRATIALYNASKAFALINKRQFVIPDDVKAIAYAILRHRISLTYEAQTENITCDDVIKKILDCITTP